MVSNSISIDREKDSELLQVQEFFETLKNNPDKVINSVIKKEYLELFNIAFENAKTSGYWAQYVIPELLKLGIVEKEELQKALLTKEQAYHLFEILFLQKHSQKLSAQDLIQFLNLDAFLT